MKKNNIFFLILLIFFPRMYLQNQICEELWKKIYNDPIRTDVNLYSVNDVKTIGIRLEKVWKNTNPDNPLEGMWELDTNQDGYFTVGKITKGKFQEEIEIGDVVISINGIDLREVAKDSAKKELIEDNVSELFDEDELIKFELMRIKNDKKRNLHC